MGLKVYVLETREHSQILSIVEKIQHFTPIDSTESMQQFNGLFEQLIAALKMLDQDRVAVRTDSVGSYMTRPLRLGEKYILIAFDWDKGDSDENYYFRSTKTEPLHQKVTTHDFYMGPGKTEDCRGK